MELAIESSELALKYLTRENKSSWPQRAVPEYAADGDIALSAKVAKHGCVAYRFGTSKRAGGWCLRRKVLGKD